MSNETEAQKQRALLLTLAAEPDDKSTLLAYVNLLGIVSLGHTLEIKPTGRGLSDHFEGSLTSRGGARMVRGDGATVAMCCRELVHRWMGGTSPLQQTSRARPQLAAPLLELTARRSSLQLRCLNPPARCDRQVDGGRCGMQLGRVTGLAGLYCIKCDADELAQLQEDSNR
jgi:hypothetical protein